jgi:L-aspartate oxidase
MFKERTDFLIIGSGVAGLRAAVELAPYGEVIVATKDMPTESSTEYAQGGIAVALSDEDTVGFHFEDTLKAGAGLCREDAVKILVEEGPERIKELISWGAEFDKEGTKLAFGLEAAHSRKRILHSGGDSTGKELERVLINKVRAFTTIKRYPFGLAMDLIIGDGACYGAIIVRDRRPMAILARATILASGGAGQVYAITTNPQVATGDGIAMAYRAGARVEDMEFVQFHPTALYLPSAPHFLLTEALRGEGGILRNVYEEAFMKNYHRLMELAPRDVVSRAILHEMEKTKSDHAYLDLRHLGAEFVKRRFPQVYSTCLRYELDITKELIPISPAAHYMMGGIKTDTLARTNIAGLFAAGETACTGVHGANRLASNSLLEGLVYGKRAGESALKYGLSEKEVEKKDEELDYIIMPHSIPAHDEIRGSLRRLMWNKVGIIRNEKSLAEARREIAEWDYILKREFLTRRELELKNMIQVAGLITEAAILRKESIGAHYRADYPHLSEDWKRHTSQEKGKAAEFIK